MISLEVISFLRELRDNNAKEWFDVNRKRYEKHVRDPFRAFCGQIIDRLHESEGGLPGLPAEQIASIPDNPRDGIMRINRDLRFSKDKTPYHTYLRAAFVPDGRKSGNAGLYLTIEPDSVGAGGGIYRTARAYGPGLPRLDCVPLDSDYRAAVDELHENGVRKNGSVIAICSVSPEEFCELDDQVAWVIERFRQVSPLIGALLQ